VVKIGVIGCSRIAKKSVLEAINCSRYAKLVMIGSRDVKNAEKLCKHYGCKKWGNYYDVINCPEVDLVYISLPNSMHEEWTIKAAISGKHVWVEKPASVSYKSATNMIETCMAKRVRLFEGYMFQHHPQHSVVMRMIESGSMGEIVKFDGVFSFPYPDQSSNLLNPDLGGGALNDSAGYPIFASRMIFNEEPLQVYCTIVKEKTTDIPVRVNALLSFSNGRTAHIFSGFGSYFQSHYSVLCSEALVRVNRAYAVPKNHSATITIERNDIVETISANEADQFEIMIDSFCKTLLGLELSSSSEKDILKQARVMEAVRLSAAHNRPINISEV